LLRCLSMQFLAMFNFAGKPLNSASAISNSTTLSHNWYQVNSLLLFYPKIFGVHEQIVVMFDIVRSFESYSSSCLFIFYKSIKIHLIPKQINV
jgi:hypothetical protein